MNMADSHYSRAEAEPSSGEPLSHVAPSYVAPSHIPTSHAVGVQRFGLRRNNSTFHKTAFLAVVVATTFCTVTPSVNAAPANSTSANSAPASANSAPAAAHTSAHGASSKKRVVLVFESPQTSAANANIANASVKNKAVTKSSTRNAASDSSSGKSSAKPAANAKSARLTPSSLPPAMPVVTTVSNTGATTLGNAKIGVATARLTPVDATRRSLAISPLQDKSALNRMKAGMGKIITVSSLKQLPPASQPLPLNYNGNRRASVIPIGFDAPSKTARAENSVSSNSSTQLPAYASPMRPNRGVAGSMGNQLEVASGTFVVLQTATDLDTVAIADPTIADVVVVNSRAVLVNGKSPGVTSLVIVDREKIRQYQVRVMPAPGTLPRDIAAQIGLPSVTVRQVRDAIIVEGEVNTSEEARRAIEIAGIYSKKVISQLTVRGVPTSNEAVAGQIQSVIGLPNVSVSLLGDTVLLQGTAESAAQRTRAETVASASGRKVLNLIDLPTLSIEEIQQTLGTGPEAIVTNPDGTTNAGSIDPSSIVVRRIGDQVVLEGSVLDQNRLDQAIAIAGRSGLQVVNRLKILPPLPAETRVLQAITTAIGIPGVTAYGSPKRLVLRGIVADSNVANAAVQIARAYAAEVDNMLMTPDPIQVNVDVQIVEINSTDARSLGVQYGSVALTAETVTPPTSVTTPNPIAGGDPIVTVTPGRTTRTIDPTFQQGIGLLGNGFIGTGGLSNLNPFRARINALYSNGNARLLSNPRSTVLSGRTATFQVGGQVPIPSGSTTGQAGTSTTIVFKDFGILLEVNPVANNDGIVTMRVRTEVSQPDPTLGIIPPGGGGLVPGFSRRQTVTEVVVGKGDTVALGGLIQNNLTKSISSVPFLSKIPILGALFKSKSFQRNQTELVIFVTPRVLPNTLPAGVNAWSGVSISDNTTNIGTQLGNPGITSFANGGSITGASSGAGAQ